VRKEEKQAMLKCRTKNKRIKMKQGIIISAVGLTEAERKSIVKAVRKIQYGRKKDGRQSLPYVMELK
jgi:hypothetical protein